MPRLPERPRLAEHVAARRHLLADGSAVVLHDLRSAREVKLGSREWELLAAADGTRDLEGILLAAAREGAHARLDHVREFFESLHEAGFVDGAAAPPPALESPNDAPERVLEVLPDFSLHCDGSGSCCRQYATVLFAPLEAARARALCPTVLDAGAKHERAFLPERSSHPHAGAAVALVHGACAYLDGDARCRIHEAGGAEAKPLGCRLFPATFVDDGESVRASAAVECACVLASVARPHGAPLVPGSARARRDLPSEVDVVRLSPTLRLTPHSTCTPAELHAWSGAVALGLLPLDSVAALLTLAAHVERDGLDHPTTAHASDAGATRDVDTLRLHVKALHARAERRAREAATWRSERDFVLQAVTWIARASASALVDGLANARIPPSDPAREAFYVRASIFGHALALDDVPLASALRDRAARLVVARAMGTLLAASPEPKDTALREPIAVVEAMLRGHGLAAYVHDVGEL